MAANPQSISQSQESSLLNQQTLSDIVHYKLVQSKDWYSVSAQHTTTLSPLGHSVYFNASMANDDNKDSLQSVIVPVDMRTSLSFKRMIELIEWIRGEVQTIDKVILALVSIDDGCVVFYNITNGIIGPSQEPLSVKHKQKLGQTAQ